MPIPSGTGELEPDVNDVLFKGDDALVEQVDVGWRAESGLTPSLLTELLGQSPFEMLDLGREPDGAFVCGHEIGLQRGATH